MAIRIENDQKIKQGGHLKRNEVKKGILEHILKNSPILESDIRKFVEKRYMIKDQKTVNTHLHNLKDLRCIEKIPAKRGFPNKWVIKTPENLKNIGIEFPGIQLRNYTKAKNILINEIFPGIPPRHYKKYFIYMSLVPSSFDLFFNGEQESMLRRVHEIWQVEDYRDEINKKIDFVYDRSFLLNDYLNPSAKKQIIEISKDELKTILSKIKYPADEQDWNIKEKIVENIFFDKLTEVLLSKRPDSTQDQVNKEVSEKIIDDLPYTSQDSVFEIVYYQYLQKYNIYDKVCKLFYKTDFLKGVLKEKDSQDAKIFTKKLGECIENVNKAFSNSPASKDQDSMEESPARMFQKRINELDALYNEWFEKCLQNDKQRLS
ncbi:MAG TPA: hypothetical protein VGK06_08275 [Methanosarcina sp.]|jgi:hypothetical protein